MNFSSYRNICMLIIHYSYIVYEVIGELQQNASFPLFLLFKDLSLLNNKVFYFIISDLQYFLLFHFNRSSRANLLAFFDRPQLGLQSRLRLQLLRVSF